MKFHSKIVYKVYVGKTCKGLFENYEWAKSIYDEKKEAGRKTVKLVEIRTDVTETVLEN